MNDTERYMSHDVTAPSGAIARPHILVADDDASTRQFLAGALGTQGYRVTVAQDGAEALAFARATAFDALLLDCRMPRGGAVEVLTTLRDEPAAASRTATALATSAEMPPGLRASLIEAGFAGIVEKPCRIAALVDTLAATLGVDASLHLLDDDAALAATGDAATMRALRSLLRAELAELMADLDALARDPDETIERMHRLRSGCGFCGATRLGMQAKALQIQVDSARAVTPAALARFRGELRNTLAALDAGG